MLRVMLRHRRETESEWHEVEMTAAGNDRWRGELNAHTTYRLQTAEP